MIDYGIEILPSDQYNYQRWIAFGNGYKVTLSADGGFDHIAWDDIAEFLAQRTTTQRHSNQVIWAMLNGVPRAYQFVGGVEDADLQLVVKSLPELPIYADSAAAVTGGLSPGDLYMTSLGAVMQVLFPAV